MLDVIIIGAGAAGMLAAHELSQAGKKVSVLEARDRLGGRIFSRMAPGFPDIIECGAEFIHGNLPVTNKILDKGKLKTVNAVAKNFVHESGILKPGEDPVEHWDVLMSEVKKVKQDITLEAFLSKHLPDPKYDELKDSVRAFVEGYDAGDPSRASTLVLKDEWSNDDQWDQYRIYGGYGKLIDYLELTSRKNGCSFYISQVVKEIRWEKDAVEVISGNQFALTAKKVLITVPLGVLQAAPPAEGAISFFPEIPDRLVAARSMGFGGAIKVQLHFKNRFWSDKKDDKGNDLKKLGFVFSRTIVPTFWTQYPGDSALLTGWIAGPKSTALELASDETIIQHAISSLSEIFELPVEQLNELLTASLVINWNTDPFSRGAYSYATVETRKAQKIFTEPIENTLYFAGEAYYTFYQSSTVEVALASGKRAAKEILRSL